MIHQSIVALGTATVCATLLGCVGDDRPCLESKYVSQAVPYCGDYKDGYCQRTDYRYQTVKQCVKWGEPAEAKNSDDSGY